MAEQFENKIKRLELENFTCFGKVALDFSPGINVFIGENGTGKTHLLKALFMSTNSDLNKESDLKIVRRIQEYYPPSVHPVNLIKKGVQPPNNALIEIERFDSTKLIFVIDGQDGIKTDISLSHNGIFIPSQEILSWYKGFIPSYENRETSIDPIYYYFAKALSLSRLKGNRLEKAKQLIQEFEKEIGIDVQLEGDMFYIYRGKGGGIQAPLEATGINKLAQLIWLILNGSLTKDTILFWDEPESGLNPKYIVIVTKLLQTLANSGCQIFVATHDYLLPYDLSLSVEYDDVMEKLKRKVPAMKFFSLFRGESGTEIDEGQTMPDLQHDAIMDGLGYHHDWESQLFRYSVDPSTIP